MHFSLWGAEMSNTGSSNYGSQLYSSQFSDCTSLKAEIGPDGNARACFIVDKEIRLLTFGKSASGNALIVQAPTLGELTDTAIAITYSNDIYVSFSSRENRLRSTEWRLYSVILWNSNGSTTRPLALENGPGSAMQPASGANKKSIGTVFVREGNLWFVNNNNNFTISNNAPVANFTVTPKTPMVGETVIFNGSTSSDPDISDSVAAWNFEWGDGGNSGWVMQSTTNHAYTAAGTYNAMLTVRDTYGAESETAEVSVTVTGTTANQAPTARLIAIPTSAEVKLFVHE